MQKLLSLLIAFIPLTGISQDRIDFFSSATRSKQTPLVANKIIPGDLNNDGHTLELVFTVPVTKQHAFRSIAVALNTQAGLVNFIIPGETILESRNRLRFAAYAGKIYLYINDVLKLAVDDTQHAYSICTPGYSCSLTDVESNKEIAIQTQSVTVGYKTLMRFHLKQ